MLTFSKRLRHARRSRKMTQQALAAAVNVHKNTISDLERGRNFPGLIIALKISEVLDVNIRWMVGHTDNQRRGVQLETDAEERNYRAYMQMSKDERAQFVEFMNDFLKTHSAASGKRETAYEP